MPNFIKIGYVHSRYAGVTHYVYTDNTGKMYYAHIYGEYYSSSTTACTVVLAKFRLKDLHFMASLD